MNKTLLALGGNLGNILSNLKNTLHFLENSNLKISKISSAYKTPAVGCEKGAKDFINLAVSGEWADSAENLLKLTQSVEKAVGRPEKHSSFESRLIDIDIILFNDFIIETESLKIPHMRAHERLFVMIPLSEIEPDWIFPNLNKTSSQILELLINNEPDLYRHIISGMESLSF